MTTKEFIAKLKEADVAKKMEAAKSPEDAYAIAKGYGLTDSIEEFTNEMGVLKEAAGELSDDDLESVAGGAITTEAVSTNHDYSSSSATSASAAV